MLRSICIMLVLCAMCYPLPTHSALELALVLRAAQATIGYKHQRSRLLLWPSSSKTQMLAWIGTFTAFQLCCLRTRLQIHAHDTDKW